MNSIIKSLVNIVVKKQIRDLHVQVMLTVKSLSEVSHVSSQEQRKKRPHISEKKSQHNLR